MPLTIDDLKPKKFKVYISVPNEEEKVVLDSKPPKLSHVLILSKVGKIFEDSSNASMQEIKQSEKDFNHVIADLIPELDGVEVSMSATLEIITQIMEQIEPDDNKQLKESGVSFNKDPKEERNKPRSG